MKRGDECVRQSTCTALGSFLSSGTCAAAGEYLWSTGLGCPTKHQCYKKPGGERENQPCERATGRRAVGDRGKLQLETPSFFGGVVAEGKVVLSGRSSVS